MIWIQLKLPKKISWIIERLWYIIHVRSRQNQEYLNIFVLIIKWSKLLRFALMFAFSNNTFKFVPLCFQVQPTHCPTNSQHSYCSHQANGGFSGLGSCTGHSHNLTYWTEYCNTMHQWNICQVMKKKISKWRLICDRYWTTNYLSM